MTNTQKNIAAISFALTFIGITYYFIHQHDKELLNNSARWGRMIDSLSNSATMEEKRVALQFSDTTLPQLRRLGLIKRYTRTEIETIITVSGTIWKKRSSFFKESLLDQIFIYNKVNGFALNTKIIDDNTSALYAEIIPPDRRVIY
jgi:hypothetical protein